MKITKQKLKQIISEELENILNEKASIPRYQQKEIDNATAAFQSGGTFKEKKSALETAKRNLRRASDVGTDADKKSAADSIKQVDAMLSKLTAPPSKSTQAALGAQGVDLSGVGLVPRRAAPKPLEPKVAVGGLEAATDDFGPEDSVNQKITTKTAKKRKSRKSRIPKDGIRVASAPGGGVSDASAGAPQGPVRIRGGQGYFHLAKALGANPRDRQLRAKLRDAVKAWNKENKGRDSSVLFTSVDYSFLRDVVSPGKNKDTAKAKDTTKAKDTAKAKDAAAPERKAKPETKQQKANRRDLGNTLFGAFTDEQRNRVRKSMIKPLNKFRRKYPSLARALGQRRLANITKFFRDSFLGKVAGLGATDEAVNSYEKRMANFEFNLNKKFLSRLARKTKNRAVERGDTKFVRGLNLDAFKLGLEGFPKTILTPEQAKSLRGATATVAADVGSAPAE